MQFYRRVGGGNVLVDHHVRAAVQDQTPTIQPERFVASDRLSHRCRRLPPLLARFGSNLVEGLFRIFGFAKILIEP